MEHLNAVLSGIPMTLLVTAASFAIGATAAIPLTLLMMSPWRPGRLLARVFTDIIRGLPPVVWLFIIYFGVSIGGFQFDAVSAAIMGLGVVSAAYLAEIYRSGVLSLHEGQWEAAAAMGVGRLDTVARVVAPQAIRVAVPAATGYAISLLKDSAVASTIGVTGIAYMATQDARSNAGGLPVYLFAAALYVLLAVPVAVAARLAGNAMQRKVSR
ncbi:MAG: amino acid ABC transporter permease [Marmoricola sp.]